MSSHFRMIDNLVSQPRTNEKEAGQALYVFWHKRRRASRMNWPANAQQLPGSNPGWRLEPAGDACCVLLCPVWSRKDAARFSVAATFAEASGTELVRLLPPPLLPEAEGERANGGNHSAFARLKTRKREKRGEGSY